MYIDQFDFEGIAPPAEWFDEKGRQIIFPRKLTKPALEKIPQPVTKVALTIPYFEEAKEMQIYNSDGKLALKIDLSKFCEG